MNCQDREIVLEIIEGTRVLLWPSVRDAVTSCYQAAVAADDFAYRLRMTEARLDEVNEENERLRQQLADALGRSAELQSRLDRALEVLSPEVEE